MSMMKTDVRHPAQPTLALLSRDDVAWLESLPARWHVRFCPQCKRQLEGFRTARRELGLISGADGRQPLDGQPVEDDPAWNALEAEMRANIRLGLTAGSLASGPSGSEEVIPSLMPYFPWRWAVVCGALVFVLTAGWWLRSSGGASLPVASVPALEAPAAEPAGREPGIQLLVPVADVSRTEMDFDGSTRSRVIDGETGQVTLQQVYVE
jgi:hypothetical protein